MNIGYFDAHTHAQFAAYDEDRESIMERAKILGVGMVNVGTTLETSKSAIELAHKYSNNHVYASIGVHPVHATPSFHDEQEFGSSEKATQIVQHGERFDGNVYREIANDPKVVAIGECGLDYFHVHDEETKQKQRELFIKHIELARDVDKPLMIHCRNAYDDLILICTEQKNKLPTKVGIIHFFAGSKDHARALLALGFSFTFGGVITFARDYDGVIDIIPGEKILSETDAPYVTPVPHRGKRNEPSFVVEVVKRLAQLKNVSEEAVRKQILINIERMFNIKLS